MRILLLGFLILPLASCVMFSQLFGPGIFDEMMTEVDSYDNMMTEPNNYPLSWYSSDDYSDFPRISTYGPMKPQPTTPWFTDHWETATWVDSSWVPSSSSSDSSWDSSSYSYSSDWESSSFETDSEIDFWEDYSIYAAGENAVDEPFSTESYYTTNFYEEDPAWWSDYVDYAEDFVDELDEEFAVEDLKVDVDVDLNLNLENAYAKILSEFTEPKDEYYHYNEGNYDGYLSYEDFYDSTSYWPTYTDGLMFDKYGKMENDGDYEGAHYWKWLLPALGGLFLIIIVSFAVTIIVMIKRKKGKEGKKYVKLSEV